MNLLGNEKIPVPTFPLMKWAIVSMLLEFGGLIR